MPSWKTVCNWTGIIFLLFLGIPIRVKNPDTDIQKEFDDYIRDFNKTYLPDSEEYTHRFNNFKGTLARIQELNSGKLHSILGANYGLTKFSDLTEDEFLALHLDRVKMLSQKHQLKNRARAYGRGVPERWSPSQDGGHRTRRAAIASGLPLKFDWREFGVISPVADQGLCGACWAYSTVQAAEAIAAHRSGNLTALSVQQIIDCATNGNFGCKGGDICSLLVWLTRNDISMSPAQDYPTTGKSSFCRAPKETSGGIKIKDFTCGIVLNAQDHWNCMCMSSAFMECYRKLDKGMGGYENDLLIGSEMDIVRWVAQTGPAAVAVNALSWQNYLGGVVQHHCPGSPTALNHAVQIIGYDLTDEIPYFIAKNSWGLTFGLDGYIHLAIGANMCGLANEVSMIHIV